MSFSCKGEEAFEVANLLKDHLMPRQNHEAENGIDLSLDITHASLYDLSDNDAEKIFNECCARRHEWAMGKSTFFFKNVLVPQMISHSLENFTNFVNGRNTNWLTKGDILILRTIQHKKEQYTAVYETLIDLAPRKTEYDWTIVDTASTDDSEEQHDFEALDVTDSVFFPVTEERFSSDPVMPENFLARSSPTESRESTPIIKKIRHNSSRPSPHLSNPSKKHRSAVEVDVVLDVAEENVFTNAIPIELESNGTTEECNVVTAEEPVVITSERCCSPEYKSAVVFNKPDSGLERESCSPIIRRRSFRKKNLPQRLDTPSSPTYHCSPKKLRRESKPFKQKETLSGLHSLINDYEDLSSPNGNALSHMLIKAQIEKEIALATYYKVLTEKELLQINKLSK